MTKALFTTSCKTCSKGIVIGFVMSINSLLLSFKLLEKNFFF